MAFEDLTVQQVVAGVPKKDPGEIDIEDGSVSVRWQGTDSENRKIATEIARRLHEEGYEVEIDYICGDWDGDETWVVNYKK